MESNDGPVTKENYFTVNNKYIPNTNIKQVSYVHSLTDEEVCYLSGFSCDVDEPVAAVASFVSSAANSVIIPYLDELALEIDTQGNLCSAGLVVDIEVLEKIIVEKFYNSGICVLSEKDGQIKFGVPRTIHGAYHIFRVTKIAAKIVEFLNLTKFIATLTAIYALFHDSCRRGESYDRWDHESALLATLIIKHLCRNHMTLSANGETVIHFVKMIEGDENDEKISIDVHINAYRDQLAKKDETTKIKTLNDKTYPVAVATIVDIADCIDIRRCIIGFSYKLLNIRISKLKDATPDQEEFHKYIYDITADYHALIALFDEKNNYFIENSINLVPDYNKLKQMNKECLGYIETIRKEGKLDQCTTQNEKYKKLIESLKLFQFTTFGVTLKKIKTKDN